MSIGLGLSMKPIRKNLREETKALFMEASELTKIFSSIRSDKSKSNQNMEIGIWASGLEFLEFRIWNLNYGNTS